MSIYLYVIWIIERSRLDEKNRKGNENEWVNILEQMASAVRQMSI